MTKWLQRSVLAVVFLLLVFPNTSPAAQAPNSFADLAEKLIPAVVNISTSQVIDPEESQPKEFSPFPPGHPFEEFNEFFDRFGYPFDGNRTIASLGSGFIIDPEGYIVTNNHVIEDADKITVTLVDDIKYEATIVGRDPKTDLAVLKIDADKPLAFVEFGDSDTARVGDWIVAIGNPFGLGGTVTTGIISARARDINAGPFDDFLQTDAAINRGNSGGPMFNLEGKVIGVNTAIYSPTGGGNVGIGFAVPSVMAKPVISQLRETGKVQRGWLGVKIQKVTEEIAESLGLEKEEGALVAEVMENSPAGAAGIKQGDIILSFDGKAIPEMRKLPRVVAETNVDKEVKVTLWRKGKIVDVTVNVGELDEDAEKVFVTEKPEKRKDSDKVVLGLVLYPLGDQYRDKYSIDQSVEGLVVTHVEASSIAYRRGIRRGDVIVEADQKLVTTSAEFKEAVDAVEDSDRSSILLLLHRNSETLYVALPLSEE